MLKDGTRILFFLCIGHHVTRCMNWSDLPTYIIYSYHPWGHYSAATWHFASASRELHHSLPICNPMKRNPKVKINIDKDIMFILSVNHNKKRHQIRLY